MGLGFSGCRAPRVSFCARRAVVLSVFCPRARVSGGGRWWLSRVPASFGVVLVLLAARYRLWFSVRASGAFSRAYPSRCAFRVCLAVCGSYSVSGGCVAVLALWLRWSRVWCRFLCWRAKGRPSFGCVWPGRPFWRVLRLIPVCCARLVPGVLPVWFNVRASGGDGGGAARDVGVRGFCFPCVFGFVAREARGA